MRTTTFDILAPGSRTTPPIYLDTIEVEVEDRFEGEDAFLTPESSQKIEDTRLELMIVSKARRRDCYRSFYVEAMCKPAWADEGTMPEVCEPKDASIWTLWGYYKNPGDSMIADLIADFENPEMATLVCNLLNDHVKADRDSAAARPSAVPPGEKPTDCVRVAPDELHRLRTALERKDEALAACRVLVTPIARRQFGDAWDEYKQDAHDRIMREIGTGL